MPVTYAIIGCGAIAQRRHIPECVANPSARLAALVDPVRDRVEALAKRYDAKSFTTLDKVLADPAIDAVIIAGPNAFHAEQTIAALKAGKHVLCEKPMATNRRDAKEMIAAAKRAKKFLMIGLNQRLMPAHVKARKILQSGELGRVLGFRTAFTHPGPEYWSVDGAGSWFFKKKLAGMGVVGDLGIHKADLVRWLVDDEFTHVGGLIGTLDKRGVSGKPIDVDDNAQFTLRMRGGAIGTMILSWTQYAAEANDTVLSCENGVMSINTDPVYGVVVDYRNGDRELHKVGATATNTRQTSSGVIHRFTRCIETETPPEIDGEQGYRSLNVILTAIEAAQSGRILPVR